MLEFITIANITDDGSSIWYDKFKLLPPWIQFSRGQFLLTRTAVSRNSTTISDKVFSDITQVLIAAESSKGYDIHNGISRHISILVWTTLKGPETLRLSDSWFFGEEKPPLYQCLCEQFVGLVWQVSRSLSVKSALLFSGSRGCSWSRMVVACFVTIAGVGLSLLSLDLWLGPLALQEVAGDLALFQSASLLVVTRWLATRGRRRRRRSRLLRDRVFLFVRGPGHLKEAAVLFLITEVLGRSWGWCRVQSGDSFALVAGCISAVVAAASCGEGGCWVWHDRADGADSGWHWAAASRRDFGDIVRRDPRTFRERRRRKTVFWKYGENHLELDNIYQSLTSRPNWICQVNLCTKAEKRTV